MILISQFPWGWGVAFAKISIALLLLRFKTTPLWRAFLYAMIAIQVGCALTANIIQLAQCRPIAASWDPTIPGGQCWDPMIAQRSVYVLGAIAAVTDVIFALIPISFLKNLQRPFRDKVVLTFLMGLGVFTSAAVIVKLNFVGNFGKTGDVLWDTVDLAAWSVVEQQVGIIAACVPCLRTPFERILRRLGLLTRKTINGSGYINAEGGSYSLHNVTSKKVRIEIPTASSEQSILPQQKV